MSLESIKATFPSFELGADASKQDIANRAAVIDDLKRMERIGPNDLPTGAQIHDVLAEQIAWRLRLELSTDIESRGYAGKSAAAIADLLNSGYSVKVGETSYTPRDQYGNRILGDDGAPLPDVVTDVTEMRIARWASLIVGIPFAPAAATEVIVSDVLSGA